MGLDVTSGSHCTHPTGGLSFVLNIKTLPERSCLARGPALEYQFSLRVSSVSVAFLTFVGGVFGRLFGFVFRTPFWFPRRSLVTHPFYGLPRSGLTLVSFIYIHMFFLFSFFGVSLVLGLFSPLSPSLPPLFSPLGHYAAPE